VLVPTQEAVQSSSRRVLPRHHGRATVLLARTDAEAAISSLDIDETTSVSHRERTARASTA